MRSLKPWCDKRNVAWLLSLKCGGIVLVTGMLQWRADDWKLVHVTTFYKKGWKKDLGNYRSFSLTLVWSGKAKKKIILTVTMLHVPAWAQKRQVLLLISFYDQLTSQVDEMQST